MLARLLSIFPFDDIYQRYLAGDARRRLFLIAMSLTAWHQQQHQWPQDLTVLRAAASALPLDPFTGRAFSYERTSQGCKLYSWGWNQKNDQGQAEQDGDHDDICWHLGKGPTAAQTVKQQ